MNGNYDKEGTFTHTVAILPGTGELNNKVTVSNEVNQGRIEYKNGPLITQSKFHFTGQGQITNVAPGQRKAFLRIDNMHPSNPDYAVLVRFTALITNTNNKRGAASLTHEVLGVFQLGELRADGISQPFLTDISQTFLKAGTFKTGSHPLWSSFEIEYHNSNSGSVDDHNVTFTYEVLLDKNAEIDVVVLNN